MLHVRQHFFHEFLFAFLSFFEILTSLWHLLHYSFLSVMKKNVWHSIEQCTIDASVDQWHSQLKTCVYAEGGHFKHMTEINMYRKTKK